MVYTTLEAVKSNLHGIFESSRLGSAHGDGHILDLVVKDSFGGDAIDVDNGVALVAGGYTGDGLQIREAKVAGVKDMICVAGNPATIKDAVRKREEEFYNFYNKAGSVVKGYTVANDPTEVFAVAEYQITDGTVKEGATVVVNGNGGYKVVDTDLETLKTTNGFIGKVHSIGQGTFYNMVRISVVQNVQLA